MKRLLFIFLIFIAACTTKGNINNLGAEEFKELLENEDVFLIDVHIPKQQHIKGTDAFLPYNEIDKAELPDDKSVPIAVYCRSGSMSTEASQELIDMGYKNVYNLVGGTNAWRAKGYGFEVN
ncbi:TPA: rhodanese-like domain-containing protein [Candidatus Woesearchaeota archaeon]|nr:Rhodanese protein [archaeon GW2011_AR15]MBS3104608.1 rhodanese-like domain-containing protein [Candidatus Woesearchaeota archaeon]HIH41077.1 rhodanese-like domain-containing protein [Candidatus Woesearchaeota archaeon]